MILISTIIILRTEHVFIQTVGEYVSARHQSILDRHVPFLPLLLPGNVGDG